MADGKNVLGNEKRTCIPPLYFVNVKESHEMLRTNLKPFFDFRNRCLNVELVSMNGLEPTFVLVKVCAFPMDI